MLVNVPLDTFVYLTVCEGNQMKYTVIGGNPEKLEGRSAIQQGLSKVEESTGRKLLKFNPDKCEDFLWKTATLCSSAGGQGPLQPGDQQMAFGEQWKVAMSSGISHSGVCVFPWLEAALSNLSVAVSKFTCE